MVFVKGVSLLIFLDVSVVLDSTRHGFLLGRLLGLGVWGAFHWWFLLLWPMPEGGAGRLLLFPLAIYVMRSHRDLLSPIIFNIYMKLLGKIIQEFGMGDTHWVTPNFVSP